MDISKRFILSLFFLYAYSTLANMPTPRPMIIPEPLSMQVNDGSLDLPAKIIISTGRDSSANSVGHMLAKRLEVSGRSVEVVKSVAGATIELKLLQEADTSIGPEGYFLKVDRNKIHIRANKPAGLYYATQSLLQLFPAEIESKDPQHDVSWTIPCVDIKDRPRFAWRGLMFDVARHFFAKQEVMRFIDQMVKFKYNLLHLHLTDDEGWRLEIKSYPKLTSVGAWNVKKEGYFGYFSPPEPDEPRNYGGFYTQDDMREIIQYAAERYVNIMPEIDVPGHSLAAVASYPELSCTPEAYKYQVRSGERIIDWTKAKPRALVDNTLCPANEKVYEFLDKVIAEVAALFPFEYIHMGGDECTKNFWEQNEAIKSLAKANNLKNMDEVQAYFEKRVEQIVTSKGKKFMGWDEILEGGLPPSAAVMSWRGMKGGTQAARSGHQVVMTPSQYVYLDYMQGDIQVEPRVYASLRLSKTYQFEPLPDSVDAAMIKGGQGNLWTEQIYNMRHAEYMLWPRALAVSESLWSARSKKNWENFFSKVENQFTRFDFANVKYAPSVYDPAFTTSVIPGRRIQITMDTEIKGLDLYYSFDNSFPDNYYPKYTQPLIAPKDATTLKVISYRNGKPIGRMITYSIKEIQNKVKTN